MNGIVREEKRREDKRKEKKTRVEKPYPALEILFPLGGHPLLPSTTPIADSINQSIKEEKIGEESIHNIQTSSEWTLNVLREERGMEDREKKRRNIRYIPLSTMGDYYTGDNNDDENTY